jgi:hypothetical protein
VRALIDLHSSLAKIMDEYIGDRDEGFLFETENGKMQSPETLFRDGFKTIFKKMGRAGVRFRAFRRVPRVGAARVRCPSTLD